MENADKVIQLLRDTKERLFTKEWQQGKAGHYHGPNCLLGAIAQATRDSGQPIWNNTVTASCWKILEQELGERIDHFNDRPETTFDDIVDVIDSSIKALES